jgi:hypothetical protein
LAFLKTKEAAVPTNDSLVFFAPRAIPYARGLRVSSLCDDDDGVGGGIRWSNVCAGEAFRDGRFALQASLPQHSAQIETRT